MSMVPTVRVLVPYMWNVGFESKALRDDSARYTKFAEDVLGKELQYGVCGDDCACVGSLCSCVVE